MSLLSIRYAPTATASQCVFGIFFSFYQCKFLGFLEELPLNAEKSALLKLVFPVFSFDKSVFSAWRKREASFDEDLGEDRPAEAEKFKNIEGE